MELTEIILSILFLSGFLFFIVVTFSYAISKSKSKANKHTKVNYEHRPIKIINQKIRFENQNTTVREKYSSEMKQRELNAPNVNQIQNSPKIIKIATSKNSSFTIEEIEERKKNGNGSRYSIINDKINKIKIKAANFYL